jgi:hypothetical protein
MHAARQYARPWETPWFFWLWAPLLALLIACSAFVGNSESRAAIAIFVLAAAFLVIVPLVQYLAINLEHRRLGRLPAALLGTAAACLATLIAFVASIHW